MNYGIINNRRPNARQSSSMTALLADPRMREMAKQLGLQPQDFNAQAETIWQTLNDLSSSDPKTYHSFIQDQLQDGPPVVSSSSSFEVSPPRSFTPVPGFVIKCSMYHSIKCQQQETKLFVNLCSHELVDVPQKTPYSKVPADPRALSDTSNLHIPLVVGPVREISDANGALCCVIDVVVNPWVCRRSQWDANFKRDVMNLALHWIQQDAGVRLVTLTGKFIKARYKGGVKLGNEIMTSKFRLQETKIESPTDLLRQMNLEETKENDVKRELTITAAVDTISSSKGVKGSLYGQKKTLKSEEKKIRKPKLIEEVASSRKTQQPRATTAAKTRGDKKEKSTAVKRGFLNATKASLYPTGSTEGRPSSAYVNLLSRSQVVDLRDTTQPAKSKQNDVEYTDHVFEELCAQAEPDLIQQSHRDPLFSDEFQELATLLT